MGAIDILPEFDVGAHVHFGGGASGAEEGVFASDACVFRPGGVDGDEVSAVLAEGKVGDCWCWDVGVVYWIAPTDAIVECNLVI